MRGVPDAEDVVVSPLFGHDGLVLMPGMFVYVVIVAIGFAVLRSNDDDDCGGES